MPKLSIITINLNNLPGLQKTMESVFAQTFTDYEYIVVDGGSNDGSKEYIQQQSDRLTYWVSEKDGGVYQAMNKAVLKAKGEYLLFPNSGDYYNSGDSVRKLIENSDDKDLIYGNILVQADSKSWIKKYPSVLSFKYFLKDTLPHPATLIKKSVLEKAGLFDEGFKIVSDWQFFLDAVCKLNATYTYLDDVITVFPYNGISSLPENWELNVVEKKIVLENNYNAYLPDYKQCDETERLLKNIKNSRWFRIRENLKKLGI